MAGLGNLDSLYQTFLGQTTNALNQPQAPWQQELMETVNPEKVRRDNIKQALAQASMALATTPGNFLQGLSVAAGTGANSYLQAKQQAEQDRIKANQLVQLAQQKDQDRRLSLLMDAIGVNRNITSDQRADRQETRQQAESDARTAYWNNRGNGKGGTSVDAAIERRRSQAASAFFRWQSEYMRSSGGSPPSEEERNAAWADVQQKFRVQDDGSDPPQDYTAEANAATDAGPEGGGNVSQFDLMTGGGKPPAVTSPKPQSLIPKNQSASSGGQYRDGQTATNPQTGERLIYRNGQWQPVR